MGKTEGRNLTPWLKIFRDILLGRRHNEEASHLRFVDSSFSMVPSRADPRIPKGPNSKLYDNNYYLRNVRAEVAPPVVIEKVKSKPFICLENDVRYLLPPGPEQSECTLPAVNKHTKLAVPDIIYVGGGNLLQDSLNMVLSAANKKVVCENKPEITTESVSERPPAETPPVEMPKDLPKLLAEPKSKPNYQPDTSEEVSPKLLKEQQMSSSPKMKKEVKPIRMVDIPSYFICEGITENEGPFEEPKCEANIIKPLPKVEKPKEIKVVKAKKPKDTPQHVSVQQEKELNKKRIIVAAKYKSKIVI